MITLAFNNWYTPHRQKIHGHDIHKLYAQAVAMSGGVKNVINPHAFDTDSKSVSLKGVLLR